jgi:hypothetical protein
MHARRFFIKHSPDLVYLTSLMTGQFSIENIVAAKIAASPGQQLEVDAPNGFSINTAGVGMGIKTNADVFIDAPLVKFSGNVQTKMLHLGYEDNRAGVQVSTTGVGYFDVSPSSDPSITDVFQKLVDTCGKFVVSDAAGAKVSLVAIKLEEVFTQDPVLGPLHLVRVTLSTPDVIAPATTVKLQFTPLQDSTMDGAGMTIDHVFQYMPAGGDYKQSIEWHSMDGLFQSDGNLITDVPSRSRWEVAGGNLMIRGVNDTSFMFGIDDAGNLNVYKVVNDVPTLAGKLF